MSDQKFTEDVLLNQVYNLIGSGQEEDLGTLIEERREELGISQRQMCRVLGIKYNTLKRITQGDAQKVDLLTLFKLSHFLGLGVEGFSRLFAAGMSTANVSDLEAMRKRNFLVDRFDLEALRSVGFIDSITNEDAIVDKIERFFGIGEIFRYDDTVARPLLSQPRTDNKDKMRELWSKSAFAQFERYPNPHEYERENLMDLVPQISQYTRFEERGLLTVAKALYKAGVTVIVQSQIPGVQARGATFVVNGKPCVALTDYRKDYSTLWFALLHELAHVLYDWERLQSLNYHISDDEDMMLLEENANFFASEMLIAEEKLDYIASQIESPHVVKRFAKKNNLHPAIIYGQYSYKKYEETGDNSWFSRFRDHYPDVEPAIRPLKSNPWRKERVDADTSDVINQLEAKSA